MAIKINPYRIYRCPAFDRGSELEVASSVVTDVSAPVSRFWELADDARALFAELGVEGTLFGYARDGNQRRVHTRV